jgi:hypothetical protein
MADDHQAVAAEDVQEETNVIKEFWDNYTTHGIHEALRVVREQSETGDFKELEEQVPVLVQAARDRDIDIIQFLHELDEALAEEVGEEDATSGVDNGDRGISTVSSDEDDQPQDEDESESARDADGEDRS